MQHFLQEHEVQNILIRLENRKLVISDLETWGTRRGWRWGRGRGGQMRWSFPSDQDGRLFLAIILVFDRGQRHYLGCWRVSKKIEICNFSGNVVPFTWLIILQYPFVQSWELLQYSQGRLVRIKLQFTFSIELICCWSLRNASTFSTIWSTLISSINLELDVLKMQWEQSKLSNSLMSSRLDLPVAANTVGWSLDKLNAFYHFLPENLNQQSSLTQQVMNLSDRTFFVVSWPNSRNIKTLECDFYHLCCVGCDRSLLRSCPKLYLSTKIVAKNNHYA